MSAAPSSILAAPAPVLVFGLGGLIPFVGLAALSVFVPGTLRQFWLETLAQYGAVILAFVGALQWGYAVAGRTSGARAWIRYGWSVLPALVGWLSLQLPFGAGLQVQAVALIVSVAVDRVLTSGFPAPEWLMPVRYLLTAVAAACLFVASYA